MIALQRINGDAFVLNSDLIETIEAASDTIIRLTTGKTLIAKNSVEDIVRKVIKYKQLCNQTIQVVQKQPEEAVPKK